MHTGFLDELIKKGIADGVFPGACYAVQHKGTTVQRFHGHFTYDASSPKVSPDALWDLASLTKVVGTTTGAMVLHDLGKLSLDDRVASILPAFAQNGKEHVTVRNLLQHDSGLVAFRRYEQACATADAVMDAIYAEPLEYATGTKTIYSDLSMIVLGKVLEQIAGRPLDRFLSESVFQPCGMNNTMFCPPESLRLRCVPTEAKEPAGEAYFQGEVHDPTARMLGGVAGHAGMFSSLADLCRFTSAIMNDSVRLVSRLVSADTARLWTRRQRPESSRALGWDTPSKGSSAGTKLSARAFGHTGYTGTSIWCDPAKNLFVILMTNRVHPTAANTKILKFRPEFHDAVVYSL